MTGSEPPAEQDAGEVFEIDRIRQLVELMEQHGLSEIDLRRSKQRIRLRRGPEETSDSLVPMAPVAPVSTPPQPIVASGQRVDDDQNVVLIKSPMVGTFYGRPNPDAEAFVKIGDRISADTTVCIIEAMKVFNEIPAEVSGKVVAVLVEDEEPVEFGKPLFKVDTST